MAEKVIYVTDRDKKQLEQLIKDARVFGSEHEKYLKELSVRQEFSMIVDRPFFCAIRDNETGTILFMGSIVELK